MRVNAALLAAGLFAAACSCESRPNAGDAEAAAPPVVFPGPVVEGLPRRTPTTLLELRRTEVRLTNHELVETWPRDAVERARSEAPADLPRWPWLERTVERASRDDLRALLELARSAERSATGRGSGAGVYTLHVAEDVAFAKVEEALVAGRLAGYGTPQVAFGDYAFRWPVQRRSGEAADPLTPRLQVRVSRENIQVWRADQLLAAPCERPSSEQEFTFLPEAPAEAMARCLENLAEASSSSPLSLLAEADVPFGRVAPLLQYAARSFPTMRVTSVARPPTAPREARPGESRP